MVCFTDGSKLRWPVRKFFEIPAYGSLLACEPFHRFEDLGFVEGENFVEATPDVLPDVVKKALSDQDWTLQMILSAQEMVKKNHSATARIIQFSNVLSAIIKRDYAGAHWDLGNLIVEVNDDTPMFH